MAKYYTMSDCALKCSTITQFLATIISKGSKIRLALDIHSVLEKKYFEVINDIYPFDDIFGTCISGMLGLIIYSHETYAEYFSIDENSSDPVMDVCCQTIDKCIVVGSINKCRWSSEITPQKEFKYHGKEITIIESNDIIFENANHHTTYNNTTYNISDSMIAGNNSKIEKSQNH